MSFFNLSFFGQENIIIIQMNIVTTTFMDPVLTNRERNVASIDLWLSIFTYLDNHKSWNEPKYITNVTNNVFNLQPTDYEKLANNRDIIVKSFSKEEGLILHLLLRLIVDDHDMNWCNTIIDEIIYGFIDNVRNVGGSISIDVALLVEKLSNSQNLSIQYIDNGSIDNNMLSTNLIIVWDMQMIKTTVLTRFMKELL